MGRRPKLTAAQCDEARWFYHHTDLTMAAIGRRLGVTGPTIGRVIDGAYTPRPGVPPDPGTIDPTDEPHKPAPAA